MKEEFSTQERYADAALLAAAGDSTDGVVEAMRQKYMPPLPPGPMTPVDQDVLFTGLEMAEMVRGASVASAVAARGGVWKTGYIEWPQAISAEHAQKLHRSNFGKEEEAVFITKILKNGVFHDLIR